MSTARKQTAIEKEGREFVLPSSAVESYKYTDLSVRLKGLSFHPVSPLMEISCGLDETQSFPDGLSLKPCGALESFQEDSDSGALCSLALAFAGAGSAIEVPRGFVEDPVNPVVCRVRASDSGMSHFQRLIRVEEGASLTVLDMYDEENSPSRTWLNGIAQIHVASGGQLRHYHIFRAANAHATQTLTTHVALERDSSYESFFIACGQGLLRHTVYAHLRGENADFSLSGVQILDRESHADTTVSITHTAPHGRSNQHIKSVVGQRAHGVFQGKVHVPRTGQKTDAYQLSQAVLLSPEARMDTKPELEIYADDVRCSHGATTGQMEEDALFYLRSRGIAEPVARQMILSSFCADALERITNPAIKTLMTEAVDTCLTSLLQVR